MNGRDVVVVGVPIDSLGKPGGTELAPAALREQGIVEILGARDAGDLPCASWGRSAIPSAGIVGYPTVVATCEGVRDGVAPLCRERGLPGRPRRLLHARPGRRGGAALGGRPAPAGLAYIDGHLDLYDAATSPTGEAADMPVAIGAGLGDRRSSGSGRPCR